MQGSHKNRGSRERVRLICHLELKGKEGYGVGTSKGRKAAHMDMKTRMFDKNMSTGPSLTRGYREDFGHRALRVSSLPVTH